MKINSLFLSLVAAVIATPLAARSSDSTVLTGSSVNHYSNRAIQNTSGLNSADLNSDLPFVVSLKLTNVDDLDAKLAAGVRPAMANYLPTQAQFTAVESFFASYGIKPASVGTSTISYNASVQQISNALNVSFVRVTTVDGSFISASNAPQIPASLVSDILAVTGLQPELRAHHSATTAPQVISGFGGTYFVPADVASWYHIPSTFGGKTLDGTGQTIAVIMSAVPSTTSADLQTFFTTAGVAGNPGNLTVVAVGSGPTTASQSSSINELMLDLEWVMGMAPGAKVRLYAISDVSYASITTGVQAVIKDVAADNITVLSMSLAGPENEVGGGTLTSLSQLFAQLNAAGVTCVAAAGDGGSNPNAVATTLQYNAANPVSVEYPASDPYVVGVGGTAPTVDASSFAWQSETAWSVIQNGGSLATGGGTSAQFSKPTWQSTGSVSTNTRAVPDVADVWTAYAGGGIGAGVQTLALEVVSGGIRGGSGTSLSAPIFAGVMALANQARAINGESAVGLIGPAIYPLSGSSSFLDITSGTNGAYTAGAGYDLVSGLGAPNWGNLIPALVAYNTVVVTAPAITSQPTGSTVTAPASFSLSVTATGTSLTYQWSFGGSPISGATSSTYSVSSSTTTQSGSYTVTVSNSAGSVTSNAANVTVNAASTSTGSGNSATNTDSSGGGGGGGGAPSTWFLGALVLAVAVRLASRAQNLNAR